MENIGSAATRTCDANQVKHKARADR
jgi:hypothetical protein